MCFTTGWGKLHQKLTMGNTTYPRFSSQQFSLWEETLALSELSGFTAVSLWTTDIQLHENGKGCFGTRHADSDFDGKGRLYNHLLVIPLVRYGKT